MTATLPLAFQALQSLAVSSGPGLAFLFEVAVKGTFFLMFGLTLTLVLRRASAATRHLVWSLALDAMLVLPVVSMLVPTWKVSIIRSSSAGLARERASMSSGSNAAEPSDLSYLTGAARPAWAARGTAAYLAWPRWLLSLWAVTSILFAARIAAGDLRVRGLAGRAGPSGASPPECIVENLRLRFRVIRPVKVRVSEVAVPFTWGAFRPTVFLPAETGEWSPAYLEFALAHELAHVKRFDYLTQMAAQAACALFWFHPLVWVAAAEIRKERERACDDLVLSLGHRTTDYAELLLALSRGLRRPGYRRLTTVAMAQSSQLEARMKALLDSGINHRPLGASRALLASTLALVSLLPVAAIRATAQNVAGNISVSVHDPSGAVIPGADITLVNVDTGQKTAGHSYQDGTCEFPATAAGRYRLEITHPGFAFTKSADLELKPSGNLHEDMTLSVGEVTQQVLVLGHKPAQTPAVPRPAPQRIRVGGLVEAAKLIKAPAPDYPASDQKQGIEGTVVLQAVIGSTGEILELSPNSGPDPALIKSAMDAVRQWRYKPTLLDGAPVEVATTIEVVFQLND